MCNSQSVCVKQPIISVKCEAAGSLAPLYHDDVLCVGRMTLSSSATRSWRWTWQPMSVICWIKWKTALTSLLLTQPFYSTQFLPQGFRFLFVSTRPTTAGSLSAVFKQWISSALVQWRRPAADLSWTFRIHVTKPGMWAWKKEKERGCNPEAGWWQTPAQWCRVPSWSLSQSSFKLKVVHNEMPVSPAGSTDCVQGCEMLSGVRSESATWPGQPCNANSICVKSLGEDPGKVAAVTPLVSLVLWKRKPLWAIAGSHLRNRYNVHFAVIRVKPLLSHIWWRTCKASASVQTV